MDSGIKSISKDEVTSLNPADTADGVVAEKERSQNPANKSYLLKLTCPDDLGVMAKITGHLYQHGAFIINARHFADPEQQRFNMRIEFDDRQFSLSQQAFEQEFAGFAAAMNMTYQLRCALSRPKIIIMVSREDHCLNLLLNKWQSGVLKADICAIISNHQNTRKLAEFYGIDFHYLPIDKNYKAQQEAKLWQLFCEYDGDLLVLARYMQILSDDLCTKLQGRAINIHHSFLPGFKGAKPYQQAYDRGVKIIGATAHYVTEDLDEGPIIVQEVKAVDHATTVKDMIEIGHDIEATALARAVRWHVEDRILLNGQRTVIL
ncbi:formyltetrahydrofolate deformylase [Thalassotalea mangrovi]|uniref:Formyltetrahydrofolate deformylase n=2 Tax=Thalassotalea mangrovi TaxID=2572245 RepID=A0A4V5NWY8_9GAMM|nr:formyltetrahydrofolate deformylase [Thalassotalea mangrovi]